MARGYMVPKRDPAPSLQEYMMMANMFHGIGEKNRVASEKKKKETEAEAAAGLALNEAYGMNKDHPAGVSAHGDGVSNTARLSAMNQATDIKARQTNLAVAEQTLAQGKESHKWQQEKYERDKKNYDRKKQSADLGQKLLASRLPPDKWDTEFDFSGADPEVVRDAKIDAMALMAQQENASAAKMAADQARAKQLYAEVKIKTENARKAYSTGDKAGAVKLLIEAFNDTPNGKHLKPTKDGKYVMTDMSGKRVGEFGEDAMTPEQAFEYMDQALANEDSFAQLALADREAAREELIEQYKNPKKVYTDDGRVGYAVFARDPWKNEGRWMVFDKLPDFDDDPLPDELAGHYRHDKDPRGPDGKVTAWPGSPYVNIGGQPYPNPHPTPDMTVPEARKEKLRINALRNREAAGENIAEAITKMGLEASPAFQEMLARQNLDAKSSEAILSSTESRERFFKAVDEYERYLDGIIDPDRENSAGSAGPAMDRLPPAGEHKGRRVYMDQGDDPPRVFEPDGVTWVDVTPAGGKKEKAPTGGGRVSRAAGRSMSAAMDANPGTAMLKNVFRQ